MPQVSISIGGREYQVACGSGEEAHLRAAASLLDAEASHVVSSGQVLPESRILLMAGLMIADQLAANANQADRASSDPSESVDERVQKAEADRDAAESAQASAEARLQALEAELADARSQMTARDTELGALREELQSVQSPSDGSKRNGVDQDLLVQMAAELEKLADEMEARAEG